MDNKNLNLFWRQIKNPKLGEQELENNVTQAFLILLKENLHFLNNILGQIGLKESIKKDFKVYFQVEKKLRYITRETKNKYILSIASDSSRELDSDIILDKSSIPDGLIYDKNTSILVEAKVSANKDNEQIQRYNKQFFHNEAKIINLTWESLYQISKKIKLTKINTIPDFLLKEFLQYLEVINLSGFEGIPFFNKEEKYDKEIASKLLKNLIIDINKKDWFKGYEFKVGERPKTGSAWDYFYDNNIKGSNPRKFPHYSVYIFNEFFGIDLLFHKKELNRILKNEQDFSNFCDLLSQLSTDSPDYYLKVVHYRKLANKLTNKGVRTGAGYEDFVFIMQLKQFIKNNKNDWKDRLRQYLVLLKGERLKQISILKKAHYLDKEYGLLVNTENCFNFIKQTFEETKKLNHFIYNIYSK